MKNKIKISDFIKTGKFGTVVIGDSPESIIQKLGTPDGYGLINERNKSAKHIHYGKYEFFIVDEKLDAIQNVNYDSEYPHLMEYQNDLFQVELGFYKANRIKVMSEVKMELNKNKTSYSVIDYYGRKALKTICGVVIDFNDEKLIEIETEMDFVKIINIDDYELIGISYWPNID